MANRLWVMGSMLAMLLLLSACGQSAPAPAPTKAAPAPTKAASPAQTAAAPTKAPAAAPTIAPTKATASNVEYPIKGKAIMLLVPYPAGGNVDLSARLVAPYMEKVLGAPVEVVNKPGAAAQIATTELAKAKPDGHTLLWMSGTAVMSTYLDPEKQAVYHRKDLITVTQAQWTPVGAAVPTGSPYKTAKDLVEAAKAKPDTIKVGTSGLLGTPHMAMVLLEEASGAKFSPVHFQGGPPAMTAMLGGHIDSQFEGSSIFVSNYKSGKLKVIGLFDDSPSKTFPEAELFPKLGYDVQFGLSLGMLAPAGTPKEIVDKLAAAVKTATESEEFAKKSDELGYDIRYLDNKGYEALWTTLEKGVASVIKKVRGQVREK